MNLWKRFLGLIPKEPMVTGTIMSGAGPTYIVTMTDGGETVCWSTDSYSVNDPVFVKGAQIVGPAPALTPATIDLYP